MDIKTAVVFSLIQRIVFLILRFVVYSFCWFCDELQGVNAIRRKCEQPDHYHISAEILTIRGRKQFCPTDLVSLSHFILTHESFTAPEYALEKDSVSLFFLNEKVAVFCDSGESTPLWDLKYGGLYGHSSFAKSAGLIVMPISSFLRLSDKVGAPQSEVVFIGNTGRCGSTLLMNMFAKTGRCSTRSEPQSLNCLANMLKRNAFVSEKEKKNMFLATIQVDCKPLSWGSPAAVVFKISATNIILDTLIREYFPQGRHMFLYRNMPDTTRSFMNILSALPGMYVAAISNGNRFVMDGLLEPRFLCTHNPLRIKFNGFLEYSTLMWVGCVKHYLEQRASPAFRYDDLMQNPREVFTEMANVAGLNPDCVDQAMSALDVHSQQDTPVAADRLIKTHVRQRDIETACEKMLRIAGLPALAECAILPGTKCVQGGNK